jgi:hypothetical protein
MESTKARIQCTVHNLYDAVLNAIPEGKNVEKLQDEEELEGFFTVFFTNKGFRGMAVGTIGEEEVLEYLDEVCRARVIASGRGQSIVTDDDIEEARGHIT